MKRRQAWLCAVLVSVAVPVTAQAAEGDSTVSVEGDATVSSSSKAEIANVRVGGGLGLFSPFAGPAPRISLLVSADLMKREKITFGVAVPLDFSFYGTSGDLSAIGFGGNEIVFSTHTTAVQLMPAGRAGIEVMKNIDVYADLGLGLLFTRTVSAQTFRGETGSNNLYFGFKFGLGARIGINDRLSVFVEPVNGFGYLGNGTNFSFWAGVNYAI